MGNRDELLARSSSATRRRLIELYEAVEVTDAIGTLRDVCERVDVWRQTRLQMLRTPLRAD